MDDKVWDLNYKLQCLGKGKVSAQRNHSPLQVLGSLAGRWETDFKWQLKTSQQLSQWLQTCSPNWQGHLDRLIVPFVCFLSWKSQRQQNKLIKEIRSLSIILIGPSVDTSIKILIPKFIPVILLFIFHIEIGVLGRAIHGQVNNFKNQF